MTRRPVGRLLVDGPAPGAWNMAVDEMLLEEAIGGQPTLRFYQWSEPTLSLGYFQAYADRQGHLPSHAVPAVRRQTGGGALLHDRELTYSLCLPAGSRFAGTHQALYEVVHRAFSAVLSSWSVDARLYRDLDGPPRAGPGSSEFLCFLRRNPVDLVTPSDEDRRGVKLLGSAQRRRRGALLQHGGLLLARSPAAPELGGVAEACGVEIDPAELIEPLTRRLAEELGDELAEATLTDNQRVRSEALFRDKYGAAAWGQRR